MVTVRDICGTNPECHLSCPASSIHRQAGRPSNSPGGAKCDSPGRSPGFQAPINPSPGGAKYERYLWERCYSAPPGLDRLINSRTQGCALGYRISPLRG